MRNSYLRSNGSVGVLYTKFNLLGSMMAIYLDEQTRPYLEQKFKTVAESDFIGKRIQSALKADRERLEDIAKCEHKAGTYKGVQTCCTKCGSFYEEGMGTDWTLE